MVNLLIVCYHEVTCAFRYLNSANSVIVDIFFSVIYSLCVVPGWHVVLFQQKLCRRFLDGDRCLNLLHCCVLSSSGVTEICRSIHLRWADKF